MRFNLWSAGGSNADVLLVVTWSAVSAGAVVSFVTGNLWWVIAPGAVLVPPLWVAIVRQVRIDRREALQRSREEFDAAARRFAAEEAGRDNVTLRNTIVGLEWECDAGQRLEPSGCQRHREHHWCATCKGWYGVPHDGIHEGPNAHPNQWPRDASQCACRPCKIATGRE